MSFSREALKLLHINVCHTNYIKKSKKNISFSTIFILIEFK